MASSKQIAIVDRSLCISCGACESVCPVDAIHIDEDGKAWADEKCISCGACCLVCPVGCITMGKMEEWYEMYKKHFKK
ncbi:4Fe-4S binding protein [Ureaplasma canigenitalium]|uniref:4Fe-4S binding protein n=1 Tax=Ureaplasma canigenitalium TaxID=42092 RepID=UPI00068D999D|nr:4Fe-4S binding protein [Ureaplasma canigenitalium]